MKNYGENYNKVILISSIPVLILMVMGVMYLNRTSKAKALDYEFNGRVDGVKYNVKGKADVSIKGIEYSLFDPNWDFDHTRIQIGDSLVKKKKSMIIKLFRNNVLMTAEGRDN